MKARTEDEILSLKPITVTFGEKKYQVQPLRLRKGKEWRQYIAPLVEKILGRDGALDSTAKLNQAILNSPDEMAEIVVSYGDLPKDEILDSASEEQLCYAFNLVMGMAFSPFLTQQALVKAVLQPEALLASLRSTS